MTTIDVKVSNTGESDLSKVMGDLLNDLKDKAMGATYRELLDDQFEVLEEAHKGYYDSETAPDGTAWAKLSPVTIAAKGHDKILVETFAMMSSLLTTGAQDSIRTFITEAEFVGALFGTSDKKAGLHQAGTSKMPARPHVGVTEELVHNFTEAVADQAVMEMTDG